MAHSHSHASGDENAKRLMLAFGVTATFMIIEVIGGLVSGSLALLADAGHMLTDAAALLFVQHACRAEEIRSRRIITGITQDFFAPRGDEARNSRAGKAHVALPCCGKAGVLLHPFHHTKFIRRHCAADLYALIPRARRLRIFRQVV